MKRIFALSTIALLTLITVSSIQAQSPTTTEKTITPSIATRKQDVMERVNTTAETAQERVVETVQEKEARRKAFQSKLEEMKDVRKQAMIERVDEKINNFNQVHTGKLETALTRVQSILDRMETKVASESVSADGISDVETAIQVAQEAIDAAQEAVTEQLEKEYIFEIEDETKVRASAQEVFAQFRTDIKAVNAIVKEAHMAVVAVARLLPKMSSNSEEDKDTTSTSEADRMQPSADDESDL